MKAGRYVALLRGVNVGGKNKLPMNVLTSFFIEAGCANVKTYIQSGNVVCTASASVAKKLPQIVSAAIRRDVGHEIPVVLRTAEELADLARSNPFLAANADPATLHVSFLADTPTPACAAALDPERSSPDAFVLRGRDIYLRLPNGVARTKLSNAYFDRVLKTTSTVRNWRTVLELLALTQETRS